MKKQIKPVHIIIPVLIVLVLVGAGAGLYASVYQNQNEHPIVVNVADTLNLPVAKVGNQRVEYADYLTHLNAQRVFLKGPTAIAQGVSRDITTEDRVQAYERAIRIAAVDQMAEEAGIVVTSLDIDRTYEELVAQTGTSTSPGEIEQFLQDEFGWGIPQFKQLVVRPALLEDTLKQRRLTETQDPLAFDTELAAKISGDETKRYLSF